jgi:hypothetical protein
MRGDEPMSFAAEVQQQDRWGAPLQHRSGTEQKTFDQHVYRFFAKQILALIFLQRIAIPGLGIDVTALTIPIGLVALAARAPLAIVPTRVLLYGILVALALVSQSLVRAPISLSSLALLIVLYLPLAFEVIVSREIYLRCMSLFQDAMCVVCAIVFIQDLGQFTIGWQYFPNMDNLLPEWLIVGGYNYLQPLAWQSVYIKPNAFFFKEVSFVAQFVALAFIIEMTLFHRTNRLALYLCGLLATFAGTGLFLVALVFPILILTRPPKNLGPTLLIAALAVVIAVGSGWYEQVAGRITEFENTNTSSYGRFVFPFAAAYEHLSGDFLPFTGVGAGNVVYGDISVVYVPLAKLIIEYGLVVTLSFHAMFILALFSRAPAAAIAFSLLVLFSLMGGYLLSPTIVYVIFLLGVLLRVRERPENSG